MSCNCDCSRTLQLTAQVASGYSASIPFAGSGWVGSDGLGGADFQTVSFHFAGGLFTGQTFRFDAGTDVGTHGALSHVGMLITVTLSTGEVLSGSRISGSGLRAFVDSP